LGHYNIKDNKCKYKKPKKQNFDISAHFFDVSEKSYMTQIADRRALALDKELCLW